MPDKRKWRNRGRDDELEELRAKSAQLLKEKDDLDDIIAGEGNYLPDSNEQKKRVEAAQHHLPYIDMKIQVTELKIKIKGETECSLRVQEWERELKLLNMKVEFYEMKGPEDKRQELEFAIKKLEAEAAGRS